MKLWCKAILGSIWYFRSATYWCLFCEILFLFRRISIQTTFRVESFYGYLAIAIGMSKCFRAENDNIKFVSFSNHYFAVDTELIRRYQLG